jgi:hypothetical protein
MPAELVMSNAAAVAARQPKLANFVIIFPPAY